MSKGPGPNPAECTDAIAAQANRVAAHMIKLRARNYARRPMSLENAYPGLAVAPPETLIAIGRHLLANERAAPSRWFGFGGEISALNAKAIVLLGRTLRRQLAPLPLAEGDRKAAG